MGTPSENVPRPAHQVRDAGTIRDHAGHGVGQSAGQAPRIALKALAAKVLARLEMWDRVRDGNRDAIGTACPVAHALPQAVGQSTPDALWRDLLDERAAIREYDGGLPRTDAEACAHADCVALAAEGAPPL